MTIRFEARERTLHVEWPDGMTVSFPWLWLADNEPGAFHPQTEERIFDLLGAPDDIRPLSVEQKGDALVLKWPARPASTIDAAWLRAHGPDRRRPDPADIEPKLWRGEDVAAAPRYAAADILSGDDALLSWMKETVRLGFSIVDGLVGGADAAVAVAERAGFLRRTNFGATFEVVSKPDPNNLAYTSHALPLHTDLANQEVPPGYQFLHCIANEAAGGGSVLCDGFAVAEDLRRSDPQAFVVLSEIEIPFRFHDRDYDIRGQIPGDRVRPRWPRPGDTLQRPSGRHHRSRSRIARPLLSRLPPLHGHVARSSLRARFPPERGRDGRLRQPARPAWTRGV